MGMNLTPSLWQENPASTQENTSPYLWDLKLFVEISVPLVLTTIILPTVLGPSGLRNAIARAKKRWLKLLVATIGFSVFLTLGILGGDSTLLWEYILLAAGSLIYLVLLLFHH